MRKMIFARIPQCNGASGFQHPLRHCKTNSLRTTCDDGNAVFHV
jgi:hypothetical protein